MKIKTVINIILIILAFSSVAFSQLTKSGGDICHVYLVDIDKATKAIEKEDEKSAKESQVLFSPFTTKIGEEVDTTEIYPLPNSKWFIIAKVFYTDESLYSEYPNKDSKYKGTAQSILLTIAVSKKKKPDELTKTINSSAEVTYDENTNKVRTKQFVVIDGKKYLVGLECDCTLKNENSK